MPNLRRCYGSGYLHFITFSCYRRLRLLGSARRRDRLLAVLEQVRRRYGFVVVGYVVMPEHVHLLISEPEQRIRNGNPGTVIQVLKQRFARIVLREMRRRQIPEQGSLWHDPMAEGHVWQARFYDFVVFTAKKRWEKLHYMHQNPVKRGLVLGAEQWRWSSSRHYGLGERGPVLVNEALRAEMTVRVSNQDSSAA